MDTVPPTIPQWFTDFAQGIMQFCIPLAAAFVIAVGIALARLIYKKN